MRVIKVRYITLEKTFGRFCGVGWLFLLHLTKGFFISGLLFDVTSTLLWLLRAVKVSTSSELYPNYFLMLAFALTFLCLLSRLLICQVFLPQVVPIWKSIFYPQVLFILRFLLQLRFEQGNTIQDTLLCNTLIELSLPASTWTRTSDVLITKHRV